MMLHQHSFPSKLHAMLEDAERLGFEDIICWQPGGESFKIVDPDRFVANVMQTYFSQTRKLKSFQRQLNIYGFRRVHQGPNKGGYSHALFSRSKPELCENMVRKASPRKGKSKIAEVALSAFPPAAAAAASAASCEPFLEDIDNSKPDGVSLAAATFEDIAASEATMERVTDTNRFCMADTSYFCGRDPSCVTGTAFGSLEKLFEEDHSAPSFQDIFYPDDPNEHQLMSSLFFGGQLDVSLSSSTAVVPRFGVRNDGLNSLPAAVPSNAAANTVESELDSLLSLLEQEDYEEDDRWNRFSGSHNNERTRGDASGRGRRQTTQSENDVVSSTTDMDHIFPFKLHAVLDDAESNGFDHIISWVQDGCAFQVHDHKAFVNEIMPNYFDQTKYESFRRQLNLYGFTRISRGEHRGVISHACFLRSDRSLCQFIIRQPIKGVPSSSSSSS